MMDIIRVKKKSLPFHICIVKLRKGHSRHRGEHVQQTDLETCVLGKIKSQNLYRVTGRNVG